MSSPFYDDEYVALGFLQVDDQQALEDQTPGPRRRSRAEQAAMNRRANFDPQMMNNLKRAKNQPQGSAQGQGPTMSSNNKVLNDFLGNKDSYVFSSYYGFTNPAKSRGKVSFDFDK